ncbi:MAG: tetratricopeptide repeat protein, partial [Desulfobacterales bacterium]
MMPKPLTKAKTTEEYIEEQRAALAKNPDCGTTHYNLAIGLIKQKKWDEAIKELSEAVEHSPT